MKFRKIHLNLDECSEVRIILSRKINDIKKKLDIITNAYNPDDGYDEQLFSYWDHKLQVLTGIYDKLCSPKVYEVQK